MNDNQIIGFIILSGAIAFLISFPMIRFLYKFKIVRLVDKDFSAIIDKRRLKVGVPIMGGLIVILTVLGVNMMYNFNGTTKIPLLVFVISAILGAFDDVLNIYGRERPVRSFYRTLRLARVHASWKMRVFYIITLPWAAYKWFFYLLGSNPGKGIQSHEKVIVQAVAGAFVAWWVYFSGAWPNPGELWLPWGYSLNIGLLMVPFVIFTVIAMANAVNITDGMDGLSAGLLATSFFGYFLIAYRQGDVPITLLSISVVGALLIYLYFNVPPARFQMGDVGSLALGTLLATIGFAVDRAMLLPVIGIFFVAEVLSVVIQGISRRFLGRRLFKMAPLHHHFEMVGWPEHKIVMRAWVIAPLFVVVALWLSEV